MSRKPWEEMTVEEINEIKRKRCRYCMYSTRYVTTDNHVTGIICDYIGKEGQMRGRRPDECDKYKPRKRQRRKECK